MAENSLQAELVIELQKTQGQVAGLGSRIKDLEKSLDQAAAAGNRMQRQVSEAMRTSADTATRAGSTVEASTSRQLAGLGRLIAGFVSVGAAAHAAASKMHALQQERAAAATDDFKGSVDLRTAVASSAAQVKPGDAEDWMRQVGPALNAAQRASVFRAITAPDALPNLDSRQLIQLSATANRARLAGEDPAQIAGMTARGIRLGLQPNQAEDLAAFLDDQVGGNADRALKTIAKRPDQAAGIARAFAAAATLKDREADTLINDLSERWSRTGAQGDFTEFARRQAARVAGPRQRSLATAFVGALDQAPTIERGSLASAAEAGLQDPVLRANILGERLHDNLAEEGSVENLTQQLRKSYKVEHPVGALLTPDWEWTRGIPFLRAMDAEYNRARSAAENMLGKSDTAAITQTEQDMRAMLEDRDAALTRSVGGSREPIRVRNVDRPLSDLGSP